MVAVSFLAFFWSFLSRDCYKKYQYNCLDNNTYSKELNQLFVFNLVFRLVVFNIEGKTSNNSDGVLEDGNSVFELGNEFTGLFSQNWVSVEQVVLYGFTDTKSGGLFLTN